MMSKLNGHFKLDDEKSRGGKMKKKKEVSEYVKSLRRHVKKVEYPEKQKPKPEPKYVVPKSGSHSKHSIIKHLREVNKH